MSNILRKVHESSKTCHNDHQKLLSKQFSAMFAQRLMAYFEYFLINDYPKLNYDPTSGNTVAKRKTQKALVEQILIQPLQILFP